MILKHVILHILDKDAGNLIASQAEIDLTQPGLHDYLEKIILKFQTGDYKPGTLTGEDYLAQTTVKRYNYILSMTHCCPVGKK